VAVLPLITHAPELALDLSVAGHSKMGQLSDSPTTGKQVLAGLVIGWLRLVTWADVVTSGRRWSLTIGLRRSGDGLGLVLVDPPESGSSPPGLAPACRF
jgi:hypothetical protein